MNPNLPTESTQTPKPQTPEDTPPSRPAPAPKSTASDHPPAPTVQTPDPNTDPNNQSPPTPQVITPEVDTSQPIPKPERIKYKYSEVEKEEEPKLPPPKRKKGCFINGCLVLVVLFIVLVAAIIAAVIFRQEWLPKALPIVLPEEKHPYYYQSSQERTITSASIPAGWTKLEYDRISFSVPFTGGYESAWNEELGSQVFTFNGESIVAVLINPYENASYTETIMDEALPISIEEFVSCSRLGECLNLFFRLQEKNTLHENLNEETPEGVSPDRYTHVYFLDDIHVHQFEIQSINDDSLSAKGLVIFRSSKDFLSDVTEASIIREEYVENGDIFEIAILSPIESELSQEDIDLIVSSISIRKSYEE